MTEEQLFLIIGGVPEHQKWMNEGSFDGGSLNEDQKKLREIYKKILNTRLQQPALFEGNFFIDLS